MASSIMCKGAAHDDTTQEVASGNKLNYISIRDINVGRYKQFQYFIS